MNKFVISLFAASALVTCLNADKTKLEDVLVTAKVKSEVIDTAGSFNIVDEEQIKISNAQSVQGILEESVGINVSANDRSLNGRKNITFRGMNPEHTAILINGKRVSNTDAQIGHSDFQYNWIPMSAISKIEIVRGPMSSLYGSKALGGVVNIITKKPINELEGALEIKYSRSQDKDQGKGISLNLAGQLNDKFAINAFVEKSKQDVVEGTKRDDESSDFEGKDITNFVLDTWYTIDDTQEVTVSILNGKEIRDAVSFDMVNSKRYAIINTVAGKNLQVNNYFDKLYNIEKEHYSLGYNKVLDFGVFNTKIYKTSSDVHADSFKYTHELDDTVFNAELILDNFDNNYIVVGMDYRKEAYSKKMDEQYRVINIIGLPPMEPREDFSNDIKYKSLYFQDEISVTDDFLLTLGGRVDKHEMFSTKFSPKVYGVYKIDENQRLKAGYGRGFNAPTISQISDNYEMVNPSAGHAFKGNSKLKPEISDTYELGYEYYGEMDIFKATAFYTKVKDLISSEETNIDTKARTLEKPPRSIFFERYSNIGETELKGLELEYSREAIFNNLDFSAHYTYLDTKDKDKNRELNFRPKHKINTSLIYHFDDTLYANLSVAYTGKQKNYDDIEKKFTQMGYYVTSKLQVSKDFTKNLNMRFGIDNLTNEKLHKDFNFQLRPRTLYTNLTYKF